MAAITLGIGSSHSPMLSIEPGLWAQWGSRDTSNPSLFDRTGRSVTFEELVSAAPAGLDAELRTEVYERKAARCAAALDRLAETIAEARLDLLVLVGDDQFEHIGDDNLPSILVYHGPSIRNTKVEVPDGAPAEVAQMLRGYYEPDTDRDYPVHAGAARFLIDGLLDRQFDIASSVRLPAPRAEGHALQFVHRRLLPPDLAIVPILLNTYVPPTQPRAARCWALGEAIADVFAGYDGAERIGVLASGGLSHFVVWEDLDREIIAAFASGDADYLRAMPEGLLKAGTSEIKNWITTAAACSGLQFDLVDYVPGYRTIAATGTGLTFATWR